MHTGTLRPAIGGLDLNSYFGFEMQVDAHMRVQPCHIGGSGS